MFKILLIGFMLFVIMMIQLFRLFDWAVEGVSEHRIVCMLLGFLVSDLVLLVFAIFYLRSL